MVESKTWTEYTQPYRSVIRKNVVSGVQAALSACDMNCLCPVAVEVENIDTGKHEIIDFKNGTFTGTQSAALGDSCTHFALYVKDKFSLSDAAYREISQLTTDLPRLYIQAEGIIKRYI